MNEVIYGSDMKKVDSYAINTVGIPSMVLMERAALEVFNACVEIVKKSDKILIVAGTGNNGGDALALARMMIIGGYLVDVTIVGNSNSGTEEWKQQFSILKKLKITFTENPIFDEYTLIVDGLFGLGLNREVEGYYKDIIEKMNNTNSSILSIDIPSGLCADNGNVLGIAVCADITVTFGKLKTGLLVGKAADYTGKIIVKDIGFPKVAYSGFVGEVYAYDKTDLNQLPKRINSSHKGTYGKVLVVGGNEEMFGAVFFSAMALYRMGVGIVTIFSNEKNLLSLQQMIPEAIIKTFSGLETDINKLVIEINKSDTIVIGPGLGKSELVKTFIKETLQSKKPIVIDADAINVISKESTLLELLHEKVILTPHLGEMSRLTGVSIEEITKNTIHVCKSFADNRKIVCLLKDARSVISDGSIVNINTSGNAGMSTAGSGDVLSGIVGALVTQGLPTIQAATLGAYIHGVSGDIMSNEKTQTGLIASDLLEGLKYITGDEEYEL